MPKKILDKENSDDITLIPTRTTHFDDTPTWIQAENTYIKVGYRHPLNSFTACFWSLFYSHNELVNTWSHLLPALYYILGLLPIQYLVSNGDVSISSADTAIIRIYILGTTSCLLLSAIYHGASSHSEAMSHRVLKLDYIGIILNISATNVSSTYVGMYHDWKFRDFYIAICLICATLVLFVMFDPSRDGRKAAVFRVIIFTALMGSGFAPIVHKAIAGGVVGVENFPLRHIGLTILCYSIGSVFYIVQWPESRWANVFDVWGASHQIFHCWIVVGQYIYFVGLRDAILKQYY